MQLFVYEFVTGGGWWGVDGKSLAGSGLFREGLAMPQALVVDLSQLGPVHVLRDTRCSAEIPRAQVHPVASAPEEQARFVQLARQCDATFVIAPEFNRHLQNRCEWVEQCGGRLLSPGSDFVAIAADKQRTADWLGKAGIPVPRGFALNAECGSPSDFRFPAVLKRTDGAGSMEVHRVAGWDDVRSLLSSDRSYRLEEFHSGLAASVSVLCGPDLQVVLPASSQKLSDDGRFQYFGGTTPLAAEYCERGARWARKVAEAMPPTRGYFGIDLILGHEADGSQDVVIEVNPRLTTSYLGLRRIVRPNLAEAMVSVALGESVELRFASGPVQFAAGSEGVFLRAPS